MKFLKSLPGKLLLGIIAGTVLGLLVPEAVMAVIVPVKNIMGQIINFVVPLIVIGFIAPSITKLGTSASRMLGVALVIAYASSVLAALMSAAAGYVLIPIMNTAKEAAALRELPADVFGLEIPQIMSVMSALAFSVLIGLAAVWTKAKAVIKLLDEFQKIVLEIVSRIVIPILPFFIACTFCCLAYEGTITEQLPIFLKAVVVVLAGHFVWMAVLYAAAGIYSGKNPKEVFRHYGPAYITAVGTMSSAATLSVALSCAHKSKVLRKDMVDFGIPLFANIHLCGSVLTETFFCMIVSLILTGPETISAFDEEVVYTLSAEGMAELGTVLLTFDLPEAQLSEPAVEVTGKDWYFISQICENGRMTLILGNNEGANGDDTLCTLTMVPTQEPGEAVLSITEAQLAAYLGETETFVTVLLDKASVTTMVQRSVFDVNKDGVVNLLDMTRAQRYYGGFHPDADVNDDNTVDINDLILIFRNYTGLF